MSEAARTRAREIFATLAESQPTDGLEDAVSKAALDDPDVQEELSRLLQRWRIYCATDARPGAGPPSARAGQRPSEDTGELLSQLTRECGDGKRYAPHEPLGQGGMSEVVRAWDAALRRDLAMKILRPRRERADDGPEPDELRRFVGEAELMAGLGHPAIVPVHDLGVDPEGRVFFTMDEVRGLTFQEVIERARAGDPEWTLESALRALLAVCQALAHAHAQGVVHRDLKPANIMVGSHGETFVLDWGIAHRAGTFDPHDLRISEPRQGELDSPGLTTVDGVAIGTPPYLAPEHARGEIAQVGPRSDVYAVGCILYTLLTGTPPYLEPGAPSTARRVLDRVRAGPPQRIEALDRSAPVELVAVAERAMARDPADRFEDMGGLAEELRAYIEGRVVRSHRTGPLVELTKWGRRNKLAAGLAGLVILVVCASAVGALLANSNLRRLAQERGQAEEAASRRAAVRDVLLAGAALDDYAFAEARRRLDRVPERWRGWEWRHLRNRLEPAVRVIRSHELPIHALCLSQDGSLVASGDSGGRVVLRDAESLEESKRLELEVPLRSLAMLPGGGMLVGLEDGSLELRALDGGALLYRTEALGDEPAIRVRVDSHGEWAVSAHSSHPFTAFADGELLRVWSLRGGRIEPAREITEFMDKLAAAFLPGAARVLVPTTGNFPLPNVPSDGSRGASVLDLESGEYAVQVGRHRERIHALEVDAAGARCVMTSWDGNASSWDLESGTELWSAPLALPGGRSFHDYAAAWSPDGDLVALGGAELAVQLRRASDGALLRFFPGHSGTITGLVFLPDGERLMSASEDGELRVYDLDRPTAVTEFPHPFWVVDVAISPDSRRLATACRDGAMRVFDLEDDELVLVALGHEAGPISSPGQPRRSWGVAWSPEGSLLASTEPTRPPPPRDPPTDRVHLRRPSDPEPMLVTEPAGTLQRLWFAPAGDAILGADLSGRLHRWDAATGEHLSALGGDGDDAVLSPDGERFAVLAGNVVRVHSASSGEELLRFKAHRFAVKDLAWSPDGRLACSSGISTYRRRDPEVLIWDTRAGEVIDRFDGVDVAVKRVAWSPDGERIATGSQDGTIGVWDASTRELVLRDRNGDRIDSLAWSADGLLLVSGSAIGQLVGHDTGTARILRAR